MLNLLWVLGAVIDILRGMNNDDSTIVIICNHLFIFSSHLSIIL